MNCFISLINRENKVYKLAYCKITLIKIIKSIEKTGGI